MMQGGDFAIENVKRDIYGNLFILNDTLDKKIGNKLYYTNKTTLYYGADRRVYTTLGENLRVYNASLELGNVPETLETALTEIAGVFADFFELKAQCYVLRNGYVFSMFGGMQPLGGDGRLEPLSTKLEGAFPATADGGFILGGELVAHVETGGVKKVVLLDFSTVDEENTRIKVTEILEASHVGCNGLWMGALQGEDKDAKYFMITVVNGEPVCELIADLDQNGSVRSIQTLVK